MKVIELCLHRVNSLREHCLGMSAYIILVIKLQHESHPKQVKTKLGLNKKSKLQNLSAMEKHLLNVYIT